MDVFLCLTQQTGGKTNTNTNKNANTKTNTNTNTNTNTRLDRKDQRRERGKLKHMLAHICYLTEQLVQQGTERREQCLKNLTSHFIL